jgi:hypothetical protein
MKKRSTAFERNSERASIKHFWAANVLASQEKQTRKMLVKIFLGPKNTQNFCILWDYVMIYPKYNIR